MKSKYPWVILAISFLCVVFAPWLFSHNAICESLSFSDTTGAVGDTIGGITAPIVGLFSIFLLVQTLIEQQKSNKAQLRLIRDEKFENTLFNLLSEQREICNNIRSRFDSLSKTDATKKIDTVIYGISFFSMAEYELRILFESLDSESYYSKYDPDEIAEIMQNVYENLYHGWNLPLELKEENEQSIRDVRNMALYALYNDRFKISEEDYKAYKQKTAEEKIKFVYSKYFRLRDDSGFYFRHLYRTMSFVEEAEKREINEPDENSKEIVNKYKHYAQFIQAQMSSKELLILFYNSFCFPKAQRLIIKYGILENLNIENLIKAEHNCIVEYKLKHRP